MKVFDSEPVVEIFITDISNKKQAAKFIKIFTGVFPGLKVNVDIEGSVSAFPCEHSIVRVEGPEIKPDRIITHLNRAGFRGLVLEDKICAGELISTKIEIL